MKENHWAYLITVFEICFVYWKNKENKENTKKHFGYSFFP